MSPEHDQIRFRTAHTEYLWNPATGTVRIVTSTRETWLAEMGARIVRAALARRMQDHAGMHISSRSILQAYFDDTPDAGAFEILEVIPAKDDELPEGAIS